ncbi:hypothetical protein B0H16DRAFT_1756999 [Mycena metata]|uniref:Uncharacterized protein n=1 Tax=Mycena metata TaxID=1033252 RepID=A0AAD7K2E0_9AGAR|nr:hypothetical protein B0H16DRAFT_1756999 [Mycena metata]
MHGHAWSCMATRLLSNNARHRGAPEPRTYFSVTGRTPGDNLWRTSEAFTPGNLLALSTQTHSPIRCTHPPSPTRRFTILRRSYCWSYHRMWDQNSPDGVHKRTEAMDCSLRAGSVHRGTSPLRILYRRTKTTNRWDSQGGPGLRVQGRGRWVLHMVRFENLYLQPAGMTSHFTSGNTLGVRKTYCAGHKGPASYLFLAESVSPPLPRRSRKLPVTNVVDGGTPTPATVIATAAATQPPFDLASWLSETHERRRAPSPTPSELQDMARQMDSERDIEQATAAARSYAGVDSLTESSAVGGAPVDGGRINFER